MTGLKICCGWRAASWRRLKAAKPGGPMFHSSCNETEGWRARTRVTGERIRDKIAASKRKGMWMGGTVPLGYDVGDRRLVINEAEAYQVRQIYQRYLELGSVR